MKKSQIEAIIAFRNPPGWRFRAPYSILLNREPNELVLPAGAVRRNDRVWVGSGSVFQTMGGIQFCASRKPFYLRYRQIKIILGKSDRIIWVNSAYAQELRDKLETGKPRMLTRKDFR